MMLLKSLSFLLLSSTVAVQAAEISIGSFTTRNHDVTGEIVAISDRVLEVRNFVFDGDAPNAFFWADTNSSPTSNGYILQDGAPSNSCGASKLPGADGSSTFIVEFPEGTSIKDVLGGSISVWCEQFAANFGEVIIPASLEGLAAATDGPELSCSENPDAPVEVPAFVETPGGYNCEPLYEDVQVRWKVDGDNLAVELIGRIDDSIYMSFGISGSDDRTNMVGADTVVCDEFEGEFRALDYYMESRGQCSNGQGVCPDGANGLTDDISAVSGERAEDAGLTIVRYSRPLIPTNLDALVGAQTVDRAISADPGVSTFVVWAVGPIDDDAGMPFFHSIAFPSEDVSIEFGRIVVDNCESLMVGGEEEEAEIIPFLRPFITETLEFTARIGPSASPRGYAAITGQDAWGISWYINDILIPVIEMRRGTTYRFLVSGGDDVSLNSQYHPLYITDSLEGGYAQFFPNPTETVYAGIEVADDNSSFEVTAAGPLCNFGTTDETTAALEKSYAEYAATLDKSCADDTAISAAAAVLEFTPDETTPDLVYYQCVTHRSLGWEIRVIDADAESSLQVDCSAFESNTINIADDLVLNTIINPNEGTMKVRLTYEGQAWLALAFTSGQALMVGAEAVIGFPGSPAPIKYSLNDRDTVGVVPMADESQTLIDETIEQNSTHTVLSFTKLLVEPGEHTISSTNQGTFLWAVGSGNGFGQHARRGSRDFLAAQCAVTVDGMLQNPQFVNQIGGSSGGLEDNRSLWIAHGACAATAWGILVPLAVGSSLVRGAFESIGMPPGMWFQLHRGLNTLAFILTVVAFSIAVHLINQLAGATHFSDIAHHTMGLVIFILSFLQALSGMLRPHAPHNPTDNNVAGPTEKEIVEDPEEDLQAPHETAATPPTKTPQRAVWEYGHRIVGTAVLAMAWWQVQDGLGLFALRFNEENDRTGVFWGVVGGIFGVVVLLYVYQALVLKKKNEEVDA